MLAIAFVRTFFLLGKKSLLALLAIRAMTLSDQLPLCQMLLPPLWLCPLLLPGLLLNISMQTYRDLLKWLKINLFTAKNRPNTKKLFQH